jgi:hypothetical protein
MKAGTKTAADLYGAWVLLWVCIALYGVLFSYHGEFGISAHLWLTITGLPRSLLSWHIMPNGSVFGVLVAGAIGLLQWCAVAEVSARRNIWKKQETMEPNKAIFQLSGADQVLCDPA